MNRHDSQKGYSLIISIVVIAVVLLLLALAAARSVQQNLAITTDIARFAQARSIAEACAESTLLRRAIDETYTGEPIQIGGIDCDLNLISPTDIEISATYSNVTYRIHIEHTVIDNVLTVTNWERVSSF